MLERAMNALALSARAHHRILRVARTIADLAGADEIGESQMGEAIGLRRFDRGRAGGVGVPPPAIAG
jgi:magnesium chelatase family protein